MLGMRRQTRQPRSRHEISEKLQPNPRRSDTTPIMGVHTKEHMRQPLNQRVAAVAAPTASTPVAPTAMAAAAMRSCCRPIVATVNCACSTLIEK